MLAARVLAIPVQIQKGFLKPWLELVRMWTKVSMVRLERILMSKMIFSLDHVELIEW